MALHGRRNGTNETSRDDRHDWWGIVLDSPDPIRLGNFYSSVLGWPIVNSEPNFVVIGPPDGVAYLSFQFSEGYVTPVWPNALGEQQMMMHLDFEVSDLDAAVAHAQTLGADLLEHQPQRKVRVLADPDGHPFCLYVS